MQRESSSRPGKEDKQDGEKLCSGPYLSRCKSIARAKHPFGAGQDNIFPPPEYPLYLAQPLLQGQEERGSE